MAGYRGLTINQQRLLVKQALACDRAAAAHEPSGTTKTGSDQSLDHSAPPGETLSVNGQKSAEGELRPFVRRINAAQRTPGQEVQAGGG